MLNATYAISAISNGQARLLNDAHTVRFVPAKDFTGRTSLTFEVNDGSRMDVTIGLLVALNAPTNESIPLRARDDGQTGRAN